MNFGNRATEPLPNYARKANTERHDLSWGEPTPAADVVATVVKLGTGAIDDNAARKDSFAV